MKLRKFILFLLLCMTMYGFLMQRQEGLLIDDFQGEISGGPNGTVDYGAGNGSEIKVEGEISKGYPFGQYLKITYNAVPGGYMWAARGFELDAKNTAWLLKPEEINWKDYKAIAFLMYGSDSKTQVAFDIKDNGNEMWRFAVEDNFTGWKQIVCPFDQFLARDDWQPDNADKNAILDFPVKSFQFEPQPEAKGTLYFDTVELIK